MDNNERLPESEVVIKMSIHTKCNGWVRSAVKHYMENDKQAKKEFYKEVQKHDLNVTEMPLLEYRKIKPVMCECKF